MAAAAPQAGRAAAPTGADTRTIRQAPMGGRLVTGCLAAAPARTPLRPVQPHLRAQGHASFA